MTSPRKIEDPELRAALGSAPCRVTPDGGGGVEIELWPLDRVRAAVESLVPQVSDPVPLGIEQLRGELAYLLAERQHGTRCADYLSTTGDPGWVALTATVDAMVSGPLAPYLSAPTSSDPRREEDAPAFSVDATLREKLILTMDYHLGKGRGRDMVVDNVLDRLEQELGEPGLRDAARIASGVPDLFRLLHLEPLVREWCAGKLSRDVLDGLVHVLQQRVARARHVLIGFTSYDDDPPRRPASGESGPGARTAVEMARDRAEGQIGTLKAMVRERVAEERASTSFADQVDTSDEAAPDFVSAVATEVMRLPFTSGGTEDEHGDRYGAVQEAVARVLLRPEFSLPPLPPAAGPRDRAEVVAECRERALRFWQEIDALCGAGR